MLICLEIGRKAYSHAGLLCPNLNVSIVGVPGRLVCESEYWQDHSAVTWKSSTSLNSSFCKHQEAVTKRTWKVFCWRFRMSLTQSQILLLILFGFRKFKDFCISSWKKKDKLLLNTILKNSHLMEINGGNVRGEARNICVCLNMFIWVYTGSSHACMFVCAHMCMKARAVFFPFIINHLTFWDRACCWPWNLPIWLSRLIMNFRDQPLSASPALRLQRQGCVWFWHWW